MTKGRNSLGFTVWFTGLPCSGKTTLANLLGGVLRAQGRSVTVLDGDEVRKRLSRGLGFSKEDRDENIRRIAYVARLLTEAGTVAIISAVSPYGSAREEARKEIQGFVEVYLRCPVEICIRRDIKGMYQKALRGEIANFTGISDPYEEPHAPEVVIDTDRQTPQEGVSHLLRRLTELGWLSTDASIKTGTQP